MYILKLLNTVVKYCELPSVVSSSFYPCSFISEIGTLISRTMVRLSTQDSFVIMTWKWPEILLELQKLLLALVTCIVYKLQEDVAKGDTVLVTIMLVPDSPVLQRRPPITPNLFSLLDFFLHSLNLPRSVNFLLLTSFHLVSNFFGLHMLPIPWVLDRGWLSGQVLVAHQPCTYPLCTA